MVYVSLGLRLLVNLEALNMVESIGNYTRHRKGAIIYKRSRSGNTEYVVRWVPVVSGEAMAHAYQCWLAKIARDRKLPVCEDCSRCEFTKHADTKLFGSTLWEQQLAKTLEGLSKKRASEVDLSVVHDIEKKIIENCIVEDIGGFLLPSRPIPVKRTSRFFVSYMVPAYDQIENVAVEPQMHTRSSVKMGGGGEEGVAGQMIYYVEVGSAVYSWSMFLDVDGIGRTSFIRIEDVVDKKNRVERVKAALDALYLMLESKIFGAKQSRYMPILEYENMAIAISTKYPFNISAPANPGYIRDTVERAKEFSKTTGSRVEVYTYKGGVGERDYTSLSRALREAFKRVIEIVESGG